jgi:hypothetical protein
LFVHILPIEIGIEYPFQGVSRVIIRYQFARVFARVLYDFVKFAS